MSQRIREEFAQELSGDGDSLDLARAALLMAGYLEQTSEITGYLSLLDQMAEKVKPLVMVASSDLDTVHILNRYMFTEMNFAGNSVDYYHPNNSFLNKVLDLKLGIPISLSIIYLEVGWRLGLPVAGVNMPGHFIVAYGASTNFIYIDVFNQGRILSEDDCLKLCNVLPSERLSFREEFLKPTSKRAILYRMLLNLKQIYGEREAWETTYRIVDLMVITQPHEVTEIRDRGLLAYRLNRLHDAIFDINRYLFLAPDSVDTEWLEERIEVIEEKLVRLN